MKGFLYATLMAAIFLTASEAKAMQADEGAVRWACAALKAGVIPQNEAASWLRVPNNKAYKLCNNYK